MCPQSIASRHIPGIWTEKQALSWKKVTDAVHAKGGFFSMQLWHQGRVAHHSYSAHPMAAGAHVGESAGDVGLTYEDLSYDDTLAPHAPPKQMTLDDIARYKSDMVTAAKNAIDIAGCDLVEIHGAHGYLLDQFHNNGTNNRTDHYGGSVENRIRLTLEVVRDLIAAVGADRVAIRLSPHTNANGFFGVTDSDPDAVYTALFKALSEFNLAYLLVTEPRWDRSYAGDVGADPNWLAPTVNMEKFKHLYTGGPVIGAGGFTPLSGKATVEREGGYDAIGYGRWFISNPDLPTRVLDGLPLNKYVRKTFYIGAGWDAADKALGYTDYPTFEEVLKQTTGEKLEDVVGKQDKLRAVVEASQTLDYPLVAQEDIGVSTNSTQRK
jgi:N-ethylmaleimide reductase